MPALPSLFVTMVFKSPLVPVSRTVYFALGSDGTCRLYGVQNALAEAIIVTINTVFFISLSPLVSFGQISRDRMERQKRAILASKGLNNAGQVQLNFIGSTIARSMEQLLTSADSPFRHLASTLANRFGFSVDDMVDFIQAGHCSNAHTNNRPKYLIHLDFELGLNPCCIANGKQLHSPDTRLIPTFNYLKWLNLFQSTFWALDCNALMNLLI